MNEPEREPHPVRWENALGSLIGDLCRLAGKKAGVAETVVLVRIGVEVVVSSFISRRGGGTTAQRATELCPLREPNRVWSQRHAPEPRPVARCDTLPKSSS